MAAIASIQFAAGVRAPVSGKKGLKASSFTGKAVAAPARAVKTAAAGGLKVEARYDAGVGVFGNKAGDDAAVHGRGPVRPRDRHRGPGGQRRDSGAYSLDDVRLLFVLRASFDSARLARVASSRDRQDPRRRD